MYGNSARSPNWPRRFNCAAVPGEWEAFSAERSPLRRSNPDDALAVMGIQTAAIPKPIRYLLLGSRLMPLSPA